jgi:membrane fusion protein, multidrug efflux system
MARMNFRSRRVLIPAALFGIILVVVVIRVIQASADRPEAATIEQIRAQRGVPVAVAAAEAGPFVIWRDYSGTVSGVSEAVVRARSGDQVAAILVGVGDRVSRGQVLVRQTGESTAARLRQAEAAMAQARSTVERLRPLHEAGAISDQEWEQALTQLELASGDVAAARDMLTITSPLAGTVTEIVARPGMIPSAGDPLLRVADLSQLVVYLRVSAGEAAELRAGQPARSVGAGDGRVRRVALQADPATRLVEIEVIFPPGSALIPGTLATVGVQVAERPNAIQVPRGAVRDGAVWIVDEENRASRRFVQTGLEGADRVEILSGVEPGERVVVEGGALLSEGALVRIVNGGVAGGEDV